MFLNFKVIILTCSALSTLFFFLMIVFESRSHYIVQADQKLAIFWAGPPGAAMTEVLPCLNLFFSS